MYMQSELRTIYCMYGYQYLAAGVADEFLEAVVVTFKGFNGKNIPLTKQGVLARLRERYKK